MLLVEATTNGALSDFFSLVVGNTLVIRSGSVAKTPSRICILPPEILCEILNIVVRTRPRPLGLISPSLLTLQLVSKYWKLLAISTPQLWAYIYFDGCRSSAVTTLQTFILRSKIIPLEVCCRCFEEHNSHSRITRMRLVRDLLRNEFYRLQSLTYFGSLHHLFPISEPLPLLRGLQATSSDPPLFGAAIPIVPNLVLHAPRLETFSSNSLAMEPRVANPFGGIDLTALREVSIASGLNEVKISSSLSRCTEIRTLKFSTGTSNPLPVKARYPYLHNLDVTGKLSHLPVIVAEAPQLVHFTIRDSSSLSPRDFTGNWPIFPHLRTLTCTVHIWGDLLPILRTSPQIVALRMMGSRGLCSILRNLMGPTAGGKKKAKSVKRRAGVRGLIEQNAGTTVPSPALQRLDILHTSPYGPCVEEGEDDLSFVPILLGQLLVERPKLTVKVCESKRAKAYHPLDMGRLESLVGEYPGRVEVHRSSEKGDPPQVFDTPMSDVFPCHEVIAGLEMGVLC